VTNLIVFNVHFHPHPFLLKDPIVLFIRALNKVSIGTMERYAA